MTAGLLPAPGGRGCRLCDRPEQPRIERPAPSPTRTTGPTWAVVEGS
ncbi:hypothetical protein AB0D04_30815 [Streptomyces sp. NPDC048483]